MRVELRNWLCYTSLSGVDFQPAFTLLTGPNGSGKVECSSMASGGASLAWRVASLKSKTTLNCRAIGRNPSPYRSKWPARSFDWPVTAFQRASGLQSCLNLQDATRLASITWDAAPR